MGNRIIIYITFVIVIFNIGCKHDFDESKLSVGFKQTDKIIIDNYELRLGEENKIGYLIYRKLMNDGVPAINNGEVKETMKIAPPCYFYRFPNGEPRYYSYKDVGVKEVLFIIGSPELDVIAEKKGQNIHKRKVHGILIYEDGSIAVSEEVMKKLCVDTHGGLDEKDFWAFAHYYNPRIKSEFQKQAK